MDKTIEKLKNKMEKILKKSEDHRDKEIDYILLNSKTGDVHAIATNYDEILEFNFNIKESSIDYYEIIEALFNDDDFFGNLEDGYHIEYISMDSNYGLWNVIDEMYPTDINNKLGVQKYLQYCKNNNITKDTIDDAIKGKTPDIMHYYQDPLEKSYYIFILGSDLVSDLIKKYDYKENDINYEFCSNLATKFMESREYQNKSKQAYSQLELWVDINKSDIEELYRQTIGYKEKVYNGNTIIIDKGYRNTDKVALLEKTIGNQKEYIIAFHYQEDKDKLSWAYAYYFDKDKEKAIESYDNVLNGGNLADVFINKER